MEHVPLEISFNALYNTLPILMWSLTSLKIYLVGTPFPCVPAPLHHCAHEYRYGIVAHE